MEDEGVWREETEEGFKDRGVDPIRDTRHNGEGDALKGGAKEARVLRKGGGGQYEVSELGEIVNRVEREGVIIKGVGWLEGALRREGILRVVDERMGVEVG